MAINVSTIGTGGDYTTITAWEAAVQGDLITRGDIEKGECFAQVFDENVLLDGSTTDVNNYLWLTVQDGAQHDGTRGTGARIIPSTTGHALQLADNFCRIEGLALSSSGTTNASDEAIRINDDQPTIRNCLLYDVVSTTGTFQNDGMYVNTINRTVTVENCIIVNFPRSGIHQQNNTGGNPGSSTWNFRNCTIYNCGLEARGNDNTDSGGGIFAGMWRSGAGVTYNVTNTVATNTAGAINNTFAYGQDGPGAGLAVWNINNSIDDDNSIATVLDSGANNLASRTATDNASPGAGDWVIYQSLTSGSETLLLEQSSENDALDTALDLSGQFTDDILTNTRVVPWDIGAHDYAAGAVGPVQGVGASAGSATTAGVGMAKATGVGASDAVASVAGIGIARAATTGASPGVATVAGTGRSIYTGVGASTASATTTGTARALTQGVGASTGLALTVGTGRAIFAGVASSDGFAVVTGFAPSASGAGLSAGEATVLGVGAAQAQAVASSDGSAITTGVGTAKQFSAASAVGEATVAALGLARARSVATSAGLSLVMGVAEGGFPGVGISQGQATVLGDGRGIGTIVGTGNIAGQATVFGIVIDAAKPVTELAGAIDTVPLFAGAVDAIPLLAGEIDSP